MGLLPHFLNETTALLAGAIAVPALVLLYFLKLRRRDMPVSSTLLWRKAVQDLQVNAPFQKLRRNLLLLLQLLVMAALLFALARPVVNYAPPAGPRSILLIDRSASMSAHDQPDGKTRLDEAKARAIALVKTMDQNGSAMVIAFDDSAQTLQPFTSDPRSLIAAIESITPTDRRTRIASAYELANAQAGFAAGEGRVHQAPDIYLYSDGRVSDPEKAALQGNLHYERVGSETAGNIAIVTMNARRSYQQPTLVQTFVRLANFGPDPVAGIQVQMRVNDEVRGIGTVNLLPDRFTDAQRKAAIDNGFKVIDSIDFPGVEVDDAAVIRVDQLDDDNDALAADDSAQLIIPAPKNLAVLLVSDGNWFLEQGLRSQHLKTLQSMSIADYEQLPASHDGGKIVPRAYDVIVFDRDDQLTAPDVPTSGAALYFGCVPPGLQLTTALDASGQPITSADQTVLDWNREHPILRHLNLTKLYAAHAIKVLPTLDSLVLIDGSSSPLLVLHRQNRAFHLICTFDLNDSNWPLQWTFPAFLHQALQYLALGADLDTQPSYPPGTALRIPLFNLQKLSPIPTTITLHGPMGDLRVPVPRTGDFVLPALDKVGLYTTDPPIPQYEKIAVSLLNANESNLLPAPTAPQLGAEASPIVATKDRRELWRWLAAAAIPLLLLEWWIYTRRAHL